MKFITSTLVIFTILLSFSPTLSNAQSNCPEVPSTTGSIVISTDIATAGEYKIWSRLKPFGASTTPPSYWLQIDNNCPVKIGDLSANIPANIWTWIDWKNGDPAQISTHSFTSGSHILKLIGSEAVLGIDKIIIINSSEPCTPTGIGDNCTSTPTAPLTAPITNNPSTTITHAPSVPPIKGDYDLNNSVDLLDFNLWRNEFINTFTTKKSDDNKDGVIDLLDFSIWLNAFKTANQ